MAISLHTAGIRQIDHYEHTGALRLNNPPVGLVTPETDLDMGKKTYATIRIATRAALSGQGRIHPV